MKDEVPVVEKENKSEQKLSSNVSPPTDEAEVSQQ